MDQVYRLRIPSRHYDKPRLLHYLTLQFGSENFRLDECRGFFSIESPDELTKEQLESLREEYVDTVSSEDEARVSATKRVTSNIPEELHDTEPPKEDIQFRDDGHILVNLSPEKSVESSSLSSTFFSNFGDPVSAVHRAGWLSKILDQADLSLAQQTQDINDFVAKCSRYARRVFGLRAQPADLRNANEIPGTILSPPSRNIESSRSPATAASGSKSSRTTQRWGAAKVIFPRGAAFDGTEDFNYVLVCAEFDGNWQLVHLACSQDTDEGDLSEMLRLIPSNSSMWTSVRRILLGQSVRLRYTKFYRSAGGRITFPETDKSWRSGNELEYLEYSPPPVRHEVDNYEALLGHIYYTKHPAIRVGRGLYQIPKRTSLVPSTAQDRLFVGYGFRMDIAQSKLKLTLSTFLFTSTMALILSMLSLMLTILDVIVQLLEIRAAHPELLVGHSHLQVIITLVLLSCYLVWYFWTRVISAFGVELDHVLWWRIRADSANNSPTLYSSKQAEWVNIQGQAIEDSYFELIPGTLQELTSELPTYQKESSSFHTLIPARQIIFRIGREILDLSKAVARIASRGRKDESSQPVIELDQSGKVIAPFGPADARSVLLCISSLRPSHHKTTMNLIDIISIEDDENLFLAFKNEYRKIIGRLRWWFSMRTIVEIRFVHFEVNGSLLADIKHYSRRDREDLNALPPEIHPDYLYEPKPVGCIPPVGHNILLEHWHTPRNGKGGKACITRIPIYRLAAVPLAHQNQLGEAWGLEIIEGRRWEIFWYIAALVFTGSFIFAIIWGVVHHNLSDAFSVASFLQTSFAIAVGLATLSAAVDFIS